MMERKLIMYLEYQWERTYPALIGAISAVLVLWFAQPLFNLTSDHGLKLENSYAPIAGVFAIIAGFLASFYGSIQAIADVRLKRIAKSAFFRRFLSQIKEATIAGFVMSILSLPLVIASPEPKNIFSRLMIAIWVGLSLYSLLAFIRVGTKLFYVFENQPPEDEAE